MTLARSFPDAGQRESSKFWETFDQLKDTHQLDTEDAIKNLLSLLETSWSESWPSKDNQTSDADFEQWRDSVLNTWGRKINDASGSALKGTFKAFDTSVSAQMRAALASGKHLERTRRVKQAIQLLGGSELYPGIHGSQFDDSEFYRMLLREVIESGDHPGGGLQHAKLSREGRSKKKKDVSSYKGKRVNYSVHEKMVGFMPGVPLPDPGPLDEILANLFKKD